MVVGETRVAEGDDATNWVVATFGLGDPDMASLAEAGLEQGVPG